MRPIEADYRLSWKGMIDAGSIQFVFGETHQRTTFSARAKGGSRGMAAKLFPFQFEYRTLIDPRTLQPKRFDGWETDKKDTTELCTRWSGEEIEAREVIHPHGMDRVFHREHQFEFEPVLDVFSAMLHVRSQPLEQGERHRFVIYPQSSAYLVETVVTGREDKFGKPAIRMELDMRRIGEGMKLEPYKKLRQATFWLADDRDRLLLELRAKVFIGDVRMSLTGARPR
ncbi:hypothetical protein Hsar01_03321 [Haloferula sargassicola]|uniref:DUF3108 domain-containing protein n=2 Tax=Haloferula sargassicola TaxID=490096 RepID=A0ABP9UTP6_9BACT